MASKHYYLLSALPHLGALGDEPPVTAGEFLQRVIESAGPRSVIEAILLSDDLLQRDAVLAGEIESADARVVVLNADQLSDDQPLPAYLAAGAHGPERLPADALWEAYFRHAADVASGASSSMLTAWVGAEVALRNALTKARAQALGLDPETYFVAADLADADADFTSTVNEWSAAPDPLAALRVVDNARWQWLAGHESWFSFSDDELAVYAARVMLLQRWQRLEKAAAEGVEL